MLVAPEVKVVSRDWEGRFLFMGGRGEGVDLGGGEGGGRGMEWEEDGMGGGE